MRFPWPARVRSASPRFDMANPWAGEVEVCLDDKPLRARLTLGALAELEDALGESSLIALIERFERGAFSSRDVMAVLVAGLRGAGWPGGMAEFMAAELKGGPIKAAHLAAALLARAFRSEGT